jgi:hypothetical protein
MSLTASNDSAFVPYERKNPRTVFTDYDDELTSKLVNTRKGRKDAFNNIRAMFKFPKFLQGGCITFTHSEKVEPKHIQKH